MNKQTEALKLALEALEEIALAGMSPAPEMIDSKEAFHARQAWRFIGIAARQLSAIREALVDSALERMAENAREIGLDYEPAQHQEPVALPEKIYEFVPTPEPVKWHHPECEGQCIACLIEQVVQEAYGSQGLGYLQRHLTSPPASKPWVGLTDEEVDECYYWKGRQWTTDELVRHVEAKLREKNNG